MDVAFYQLLKTPLERALPKLVEKVYLSGFRILIVCESREKMELLNTVLWTFSTSAFLPHGHQGDSQQDPRRHPIWLSVAPENVNDASVIIVTSGQLIPENLTSSYEKCLDIFDGNDTSITRQARERYLQYKKRGSSMTFWKQDREGNWEKGE
jgi:DNA polymerase-3 subunit chi